MGSSLHSSNAGGTHPPGAPGSAWVGAVDWSNKRAYSLDVLPYQKMIETMEREALEDADFPRHVSRPGDSLEEEDPGRLMVALTELLAVLLLAVCQHEQWRGKVVLLSSSGSTLDKPVTPSLAICFRCLLRLKPAMAFICTLPTCAPTTMWWRMP